MTDRRNNGARSGGGKRLRNSNGSGTLYRKGNIWMAKWALGRQKIGEEIKIQPDGTAKLVPQYRYTYHTESTRTDDLEKAREFLRTRTEDLGLKRDAQTLERLIEKKNALEFRQDMIAEQRVRDEEEAEAAKPGLLLSEAFASYRDSRHRPDSGERTLAGYESQYKEFVAWMGRVHPSIKEVRGVTGEMAEEFSRHLDATAAKSTHNKYMVFLRTMWKVLSSVPSAKVKDNPWVGIKNLTVTDQVVKRELTVEQLGWVLKSLDGEMRVLFAIGIYTGMRLGDCATLEWGCVDLVRNLIDTEPGKTRRKYHRRVILPIHPVLRRVLMETPEDNRIGFVIPEIASLYLGKSQSTLCQRIQAKFIAAGIDTGSKRAKLYMSHGTYKIRYEELDESGRHKIENTGVTDIGKARQIFAERTGSNGRARTKVGFHSFRHTFASIMLNAKVPFAMVEKMLAHSSQSMTMHYFHENVDALHGAVGKLPVLQEFGYAVERQSEPTLLEKMRTMMASLTEEERRQLLNG